MRCCVRATWLVRQFRSGRLPGRPRLQYARQRDVQARQGSRAMKSIAAMGIRPALALAIGLAALVSSESASLAQTRQIKLIVPYAPGGAPDVAARVLGEEIGRAHNVTVIVENRPGGGSMIASELVARAVPDGNTILIISTSFVTNPHLHKVTYDPLAFAPICQLVSAPSMLAVGPKSSYKSTADFLDAARQNPGKVTVASP